MLHYLHRTITSPAEGAGPGSAITAAVVLLNLNPSRPMRIVRYGFIVSTAITGAGTFQLQGNVFSNVNGGGTQTAGSTTTQGGNSVYNASNAPTQYVDTAGGTATVANASLSSLTSGVVLWHMVNPQAAQNVTGNIYYPAPDAAFVPPGGVSTQLVIYPGQSFQIKSTQTMTAGAGWAFVEVEDLAYQADFSNNAMVISGLSLITPTIIPTPSDPFANGAVNAQS